MQEKWTAGRLRSSILFCGPEPAVTVSKQFYERENDNIKDLEKH